MIGLMYRSFILGFPLPVLSIRAACSTYPCNGGGGGGEKGEVKGDGGEGREGRRGRSKSGGDNGHQYSAGHPLTHLQLFLLHLACLESLLDVFDEVEHVGETHSRSTLNRRPK